MCIPGSHIEQSQRSCNAPFSSALWYLYFLVVKEALQLRQTSLVVELKKDLGGLIKEILCREAV
jgi:hypothetical protein